MNRFYLYPLLLLALLLAITPVFSQNSTPPASVSQPSPDEQTILQLENELAQAYSVGDTNTIKRIMADNVTVVTVRGRLVTSKQQSIQSGTTSQPNFKAYYKSYLYQVSDVKARLWANTAVATGVVVLKYTTTDNEQVTNHYRFTDTFIKGGDKWQLVASHKSPAPIWQLRPLEDNELTALKPLDCSRESSLRSLDGDIAAYFKIVNTSAQPITTHWLNREGKRDARPGTQLTINPGQSIPLPTYLTHPFVITDASGKCLGIYRASKEPGLVVIK